MFFGISFRKQVVGPLANRRIRILIFFVVILAALTGCEDGPGNLLAVDTYEVDPTFREFYLLMGGREVLGAPISAIFSYGDVRYQYTVAALMVNDPRLPGSQLFQLAALGLDMGISDPSVPRPDDGSVRYVEGHIIPDFFVPLYEKLGGARFVGLPLTEVHFNLDKRRYEQYFENVGFYLLEGDEPSNAGLLAYGVWKCASSCRQVPPDVSTPELPSRAGERFKEIVERLGADFTGFALTDPYLATDGLLEQVFENLVLAVDPENPRRQSLRPLPERLGIWGDAPVRPNGLPGFSFLATQGELGYNVLTVFLEYLAFHGSLEVSGPPIGELMQIGDGVSRQCFKNLCLEWAVSSSGQGKVRPAGLGYTYRQMGLHQQVAPLQSQEPAVQQPQDTVVEELEVEQAPSQPALEAYAPPQEQGPSMAAAPPTVAPQDWQPSETREISMQVWKINPMVSPSERQEVGVVIYENGAPLGDIEPDLTVMLPDGSSMTYYMYPTGADGQSRYQIEPVNAPVGAVIPFQVCIYNLVGAKFCVRDSFLIWTNP